MPQYSTPKGTPRARRVGLSNHGRSHTGAEKLPPDAPVVTGYAYRRFSQSWTSNDPTRNTDSDVHMLVPLGDFSTIKVTGSNPSWKKEVQEGVNASTRYLRRGGVLVPARLSYTGNYKVGNLFIFDSTDYSSLAIPDLSVRSSDLARDQAVGKVKNKISNLAQSAQVLTPLAEIHELHGLAESFLGITAKVVTEIAALKKQGIARTIGGSFLFNKKKRIQLIRDAQDIWLTYSFGIKPLLADIRAASKAVTEFVNRGQHNDQVSGTGTFEWFSQSVETSIPGQMVLAKMTGQFKHTVSYKIVAGWRFNVLGGDYSGFQHFGVTPGAWVSVAWETFPYSWLLDYFTTIGATLDDTFVGTAGQSIYIVEDRKYTVEGYVNMEGSILNGLDGAVSPITHRGFVSLFEFERTPLSALPARSFRFKTTDEINRNTVNRLLNLSALLKPSNKG
jgi:hypothetical protein